MPVRRPGFRVDRRRPRAPTAGHSTGGRWLACRSRCVRRRRRASRVGETGRVGRRRRFHRHSVRPPVPRPAAWPAGHTTVVGDAHPW